VVKPGGGTGEGGDVGGGVGNACGLVIMCGVAEARSRGLVVIVARVPSSARTGEQPGKVRTTATTSAARAVFLLT
jgi:hypothetical protein